MLDDRLLMQKLEELKRTDIENLFEDFVWTNMQRILRYRSSIGIRDRLEHMEKCCETAAAAYLITERPDEERDCYYGYLIETRDEFQDQSNFPNSPEQVWLEAKKEIKEKIALYEKMFM